MLEIKKEGKSLEVTILSSNGIPFDHVLEKLKFIIPKEQRKWDKDKKCWIVPEHYKDELERLSQTILNGELAVEKEEIILGFQMSGLRDVESLPLSMKKRAKWALKHLIEDTEGIDKQFCISREEWGVYNADDNLWYFESGRFSHSSPQEHDKNAIRKAYANLEHARNAGHKAYEFSEMMDFKTKFRHEILEKYRYECFICGLPEYIQTLHMHRVIPGKLGGEYVEDNVVLVCPKHHKMIEGWKWDAIKEFAAASNEN